MNLEIDSSAEGLIFDLDGTLVDTMPLHFEAWKTMARNYGFEFTGEIFYGYAGIPTKKIIMMLNEELNLSMDPLEAMNIKEDAFLSNLKMVNPIEPVAELLYKNNGRLPVSVGTGSRKHMAEKILNASGLAGYFSIVITADDVKNFKPHPETFLACAELMGVAPKVCQVFEDGDQGLTAARSGGMIATDIRPFV